MKTIRYIGHLGSGVLIEDGQVCRPQVAVRVARELADRLIATGQFKEVKTASKASQPEGGDN